MLDIACGYSDGTIPATFPCSQSTQTQSNPALAITLDKLPPGSICQAPKDAPDSVRKAFCSRFAFFMMEAMTREVRLNQEQSLTATSPVTFGKESKTE